jgi:hypothetical protein
MLHLPRSRSNAIAALPIAASGEHPRRLVLANSGDSRVYPSERLSMTFALDLRLLIHDTDTR